MCIDARLTGNGVGGVEQFVIGLARGLSQLADETIEYSFLTYANSDEWLRPYIVVPLAPPKSDGLVENEGFDLVHFPTQNAFLTEVPSIYQPRDLQHLHLPQYCSREGLSRVTDVQSLLQ